MPAEQQEDTSCLLVLFLMSGSVVSRGAIFFLIGTKLKLYMNKLLTPLSLDKSPQSNLRVHRAAHLAVEAKCSIHTLTLMVASRQVHVLWVQDFECKQCENDLH